jgi:Kef-type K+ transport system membrane component KefB/mannitol/fructose-specific phosphotransferase system IIA component (Ntr-type)
MSSEHVASMLVAIAVILGAARLLGELARRLNQPTVAGEILAGMLLGPTVLGRLQPELFAQLFPTSGPTSVVLGGLSVLSATLFMLVAGMEVDLSSMLRQGKSAVAVSLSGIVVPFGLGFAIAHFAPGALGLAQPTLVFSLFFATALSISALPVIARTLMDLNLLRSDLGMIVIGSAVFNDLVGWLIFAVVLSMLGQGGHTHGPSLLATIPVTFAYTALMLTAGRWLVGHIVTWLQGHTSRLGGVLGFTASFALLNAAFTEWLGLHAVFGAFLFGVALGDSRHLKEQSRVTLEQFVSFIFAPLFFGTIGLKVDFIANFDWFLCLEVLVIATVGKVLGVTWAARRSGSPMGQSWAIGFAMNARGAMEIILGMLALEYGIIDKRMFVALVVMAIVTSMLSGPLMQHFLGHKRRVRFTQYLAPRGFLPALRALTAEGAIAELATLAAAQTGLVARDIEQAVLAREQMMATGLESGVAVPHAHLPGLTSPVVVLAISQTGIDFGTRDGSVARIIVLALTPLGDADQQLNVLADIAETFSDPDVRDETLRATNYAELKSALGAADAPRSHGGRASDPESLTPWAGRVSTKPAAPPDVS